jgi:hypothetical protein
LPAQRAFGGFWIIDRDVDDNCVDDALFMWLVVGAARASSSD